MRRRRQLLRNLSKKLFISAACCVALTATAQAQTQLTSGFGTQRDCAVPCPSPNQPAPVPSPGLYPAPAPTTTTPPSGTAPSEAETAPSFAPESGLAVGGEQFVAPALGTAGGAGTSAGAGTAAGAGGVAGGPAGPAVMATVTSTTTSTAPIPLILPGLFTASRTQWALPEDRVYFDYGYFSGFQAGGGTTMRTTSFALSSVTPAPGTTPTILLPGTTTSTTSTASTGFNLNEYTFGLEKTFFNGLASVYFELPLLAATENDTGQAIDGLGDVNIGFKVALFQDQSLGITGTAGFTVSAPTGRDTTASVTTQTTTMATANLTRVGFDTFAVTGLTPTSTVTRQTISTLNPTYLQPWAAGLWVHDRLFVNEYFGAIVPTDDRLPTYLNEELTAGYEVYRARDSLISSVAPTISAQALIPVGSNDFNFPDQLFVTGGVSVGIWGKTLLSAGVVTPVVGPKAYGIGATVGLNYFF